MAKDIAAGVYSHWDASSNAPPTQRPREEQSEEEVRLSLLSWRNGVARWPEQLTDKFPVGTEQHAAMMELKSQLEALFPSAARADDPTPSQPPRAIGACDYTVNGGKEPLDLHRDVSLAEIAVDDIGNRTLL